MVLEDICGSEILRKIVIYNFSFLLVVVFILIYRGIIRGWFLDDSLKFSRSKK